MLPIRQLSKSRRRLATLLFTDIVASTDLLAEVGDDRWRKVISDHHAIVRRSLRKHGGKELDTAGDGFMASFDQPLPAILCALEVVRDLHDGGIEIRSGIHTGEVEVIGPKLGGISVHVGARILARAQAGEVLVSGTVRELVAGADLNFDDRGEHELKGVPGHWRVFAVTLRERAALRVVSARAPVTLGRAGAVRVTPTVRITMLIGAVVLVAAFAALQFVGPGRSSLTPGPGQVGRLNPASGYFEAAGRVGTKPTAIAVGGGSIWIVDYADQTLNQLDPKTAALLRSRSVGGTPGGVAFGAGAVWVSVEFGTAGSQKGSVLRFNPAGSGADMVIPIGNGLGALAFGFGSVWVDNHVEGTLIRLDPDTGAVRTTIPVGRDPEAIAIGAAGVWIADTLDSLVVHVDPATNKVVASIPLRAQPDALAIGEGAVWATSSAGGVLTKIDPQTNSGAATYPVPAGPLGVAAGSGAIWIVSGTAGQVVRIDPRTGHKAAGWAVPGAPAVVVADGGSVWVAVQAQ